MGLAPSLAAAGENEIVSTLLFQGFMKMQAENLGVNAVIFALGAFTFAQQPVRYAARPSQVSLSPSQPAYSTVTHSTFKFTKTSIFLETSHTSKHQG
jgi:hypothetical protein